jgi:hypothetical protein
MAMSKPSTILPPVRLKKPAAVIQPLEPVSTLKPRMKTISNLKKGARGGGR